MNLHDAKLMRHVDDKCTVMAFQEIMSDGVRFAPSAHQLLISQGMFSRIEDSDPSLALLVPSLVFAYAVRPWLLHVFKLVLLCSWSSRVGITTFTLTTTGQSYLHMSTLLP